MVKNSLDYRLKVRNYQQQTKALRRKLTIRLTNPDSHDPDFGLGCYYAQRATKLKLKTNVDLPSDTQLQINLWGLTRDGHKLHFLNRQTIQSEEARKDVQQEFSTYPETEALYLTFKLMGEDGDSLIKGTNYSVNYLYVNAPYQMPKKEDLPNPPEYLVCPYDWEITPEIISSLDPEKIETDIVWPIPWDLFYQSVLEYYLSSESNDVYLDCLLTNLKNCHLSPTTNITQALTLPDVTTEDLTNLQKKINQLTETLQKLNDQFQSISQTKFALETGSTTKTNDNRTQHWEEEKQRNVLGLYQKFSEALQEKKVYITRLKHANNHSDLPEHYRENLAHILACYEQQISDDQTKITTAKESAEHELTNFQASVLGPLELEQTNRRGHLEEVLIEYRELKETLIAIKKELDENLMKFVYLWCEWLRRKNNLSLGLY